MPFAGVGFRQAVEILEGGLGGRGNRGLVVDYGLIELIPLHFPHTQGKVAVCSEGSFARLELVVSLVWAFLQFIEQREGSIGVGGRLRQLRLYLVPVSFQQRRL